MTYVIFNKNTGEMLQTHIVPDEMDVTREALLASVDEAHDRETLDVMVVDGLRLQERKLYRIVPATGQMEVADESTARGVGSGRAHAVGEPRPPRTAEIRHGRT